MDVKRAKEIFRSEETIPVFLDGEPVWIENVDETNGMATVQVGNRPANMKTVAVERLIEGD